MVLTPGSKEDTTVFVRTGGKNFPLGTLGETMSSRNLDLYFYSSSDTSFYVKGPGEVNLIGYFEPEGESLASSGDANPTATKQPASKPTEPDSSEESSSEEEAPIKKPAAPAKAAEPAKKKLESVKKQPEPVDSSSEEDSDSDEAPVKKPAAPAKAAESAKKKPEPVKKQPEPAESSSDEDSDSEVE